MISLTDATGANDNQRLRDALTSSSVVAIPDGKYEIDRFNLKDFDGKTIEASPAAVIRGKESGPIFDTDGNLQDFKITGGVWLDCEFVFRQRRSSGCTRCHFEGMKTVDVTGTSFEFRNATGCTFERVGFFNGNNEIEFTGEGASNLNTFTACRWQHLKGTAVIFSGLKSKRNNTF